MSGNVIIQARTVDDAGNESVANRDIWIADKGEWWFDVSDNDRIDLLPEQKHYEPGETAQFQVRMPFREATALVSVEREGVIETFVKKLSRQDAGHRGAGQGELRAERVRVCPVRARPRRGREAHGPGGPGQTGVQARHRRDQRRLAGARAAGHS